MKMEIDRRMTLARAFRALRYDPKQVELSKVIVPPYDVIAAEDRGSFFDRDPHNAIRFELTREVSDEAETDYSEIAETLAAWRHSGVLIQDDQPGYYVMKQRFESPEGGVLERVGFYAELGLADYAERTVRPHERTLAGPKADRLKLLRAAKANLSTVFLLYEDEAGALSALLESAFDESHGGQLLGTAIDDAGVQYTLARLVDPEAIATIETFMSSHPSVIADGHHRYETALNYREERREEQREEQRKERRNEVSGAVDAAAPYESTLAYFANAYAPGSLLLPIHRVIRSEPAPSESEWIERLPGWQMRVVEGADEARVPALLEEQLAPLAGKPSFAADDGSGALRIFWREEELGDELDQLMVSVLENQVISGVFGLSIEQIRDGAVTFWKKAERAARGVREGEGTVALYINALSHADVFRVTGKGEVMPQKSTFFYPKVPTGLVFRVHEPDA